MITQLKEKQPAQSILRKRTRPRRTMPPPLPAGPEELAKALIELPEDHTWVFMRGKAFRD